MVDNLEPVYKNIKDDPEATKEWIGILKDNPTTAINAYHDALCKDQKENGYCDLLKLFRILGALEILKNQRDNPNQLKNEFKELKETVINSLPKEQQKVLEENKKLKEENKKEKDDLEKINKEVDKLRENITKHKIIEVKTIILCSFKNKISKKRLIINIISGILFPENIIPKNTNVIIKINEIGIFLVFFDKTIKG